MSDSMTSKMITLKSSDGGAFVVSETVLVKQSKTIFQMIEDANTGKNFIPLTNVTAPILAKVIEYCMKHVDAADEPKPEMSTKEGSNTTPASSRLSAEELRNWDKQFVDVDQETLFDLIRAADYLDIEGLIDVACGKVADMIIVTRGDSSDEFGITFKEE